MDVETFTARFTQALLRNYPSHTNYVLTSTLVTAVNEAMRSPGLSTYEYPRLMYRGSTEQRTVQNADEEQAAAVEGFSRTAPLPDPNYPRWYCERPAALGGTKLSDLRRGSINSSEEEQQFLAAVNRKDWMLDSVNSAWGARGVHLADIITERKEELKKLVDADLLEIVKPESDDVVHEDSDAATD